MSATLYREGDDLDEVLADLDTEHPGAVHVLSVSYPREGGVFGFFAHRRVGVHFEIDGAARTTATTRSVPRHSAEPQPVEQPDLPDLAAYAGYSDLEDLGPLAGLIASSERLEESRPARVTTPTLTDSADHSEFARMLLEIAARKSSAGSDAPPETTPVAAPVAAVPNVLTTLAAVSATPLTAPMPAPAVVAPTTAPAPTVSRPLAPPAPTFIPAPLSSPFAPRVTASATGTATIAAPAVTPTVAPAVTPTPTPTVAPTPAVAPTPTPTLAPSSSPDPALAIRRQLVELGVPIGWIPSGGGIRSTIESVVERLPVLAPPSPTAGSILAIAGPPAAAKRAAELLRLSLHLDADRVWTAGEAGSADTQLLDPWSAATVAACHRMAGGLPAVAVIPTESADGIVHESWTTQLLEALKPDTLWAVVDATRKPADTRAMLRALGEPDALVVDRAARTTSPASVWSAGLPIALLDGEPATGSRWVDLLERRLAALGA